MRGLTPRASTSRHYTGFVMPAVLTAFQKRRPRHHPESPEPKNTAIAATPVTLSKSLVRYLVLLLGLWTLLSYFFYIEYFPTFDLNTATSVLIALAFVTVPLTAGLSFSFLSSYLFAGLFIRTRARHGKGNSFKRELGTWIVFTGFSLYASSVVAVFYSIMGWQHHWSLLAYISVLALLILLCFKGQQLRHRKGFDALYGPGSSRGKKRKWAHRRVRSLCFKQVGGAVMVGLFHLFPLSMVLLYLSRASELTEHDVSGLFNAMLLVAMLTAVSAAVVLYVAFAKRTRYGWMCVVMVFLVLPNALGFFTQATGLIPMSIAHIAKIGNLRANRIILSKEVCPMVAASLGLDCQRLSAPIEMCNVHLMSRIGSEAFLKFPGLAAANGVRPVKSVLIPSSAILSLELNLDAKALRLKSIDTELARLAPNCGQPSA